MSPRIIHISLSGDRKAQGHPIRTRDRRQPAPRIGSDPERHRG